MRPSPDGVRSSTHPLDRAAAARDLWPGGTLDFWQGRLPDGPELVCWPESEDEVLAVLQWAGEQGLAVVTYGAGSGVCGGARGRPGTVVLDTKRLDRIGALDEDRWTVEADAGVNGQHLEDWLNERGYTLGHSPSSIWCSTVGGWAAARSAGQFSSRYGVFEDMVLQLRVVTPAKGTVIVGEEGTAPDSWMPLLLGSEGTLGVVTRVRMRIWPLPEKRWLRGYAFESVESALAAMRELMQGELWPSVLRLYDPVDTRIGGKTKPKKEHAREGDTGAWYADLLATIADVPSLKRRSLILPLSLPGLVNRVFDRAAEGVFLVLGFEGDAEVVDAAAERGHAIFEAHGEDLGEAPGWRWYDSRHAVSYKLMPIFERGGFADTMEIAMRWSDLPKAYEAVRNAVRGNAVVMAHMSHLYPEGGSIYFSFAGRGDRAVYDAVWRSALDAVLASGATTTHHHGVGALKASAASREIGPAIAGWKALRSELDPAGLMNPGRLYIEGAVSDAGPPRAPEVRDGLIETQPDVMPEDALYPWESLPAPPRWQRTPWQVGWVGVHGRVDGVRCRLGRGPRSAAGPDLRGWLYENGSEVQLTVPTAPEGQRWLGEAAVEQPWEVARALLRSDLRPGLLAVVDGKLRVGFRGPAAEAFGALASARVEGGLTEIPWQPHSLPSGPMEACDGSDPDAVWCTPQGVFKRRKP